MGAAVMISFSVFLQMRTNAVLLTVSVTQTQTVRTPWAHLPVLVKLDTAGMV